MDVLKGNSGISSVITTIIITGTLLIILVIASFVGTNLLELYMADTEFEQAKTNMILLDEIIQDVALRHGAGGYVQFNQRSGGLNILKSAEKLRIFVTTMLNLRPNGDFQTGWNSFGGRGPHYSLIKDQDDSTGIISSKTGDRDTFNIDDPPQLAKVTRVTIYIRAMSSGSDAEPEKLAIVWRLSNVEVLSNPFIISRTSYIVYSDTRTKNPAGMDWSWTDVKNLQVGVIVNSLKSGKEKIRVSELWVEVDYVPEPNSEFLFYESQPLYVLAYRGGSRSSGTGITLKGDKYLIADGERSVSHLRVEVEEGLQIKLDYGRVRIAKTGTIIIGGETVNFVAIAFIRLERLEQEIGESGAINVKVHNAKITFYNRTSLCGSVNVIVQSSADPENYESRYFSSPADKTVILLTEAVVYISMG